MLDRAVALSPQDSPLRSQYAEALFAAGELGPARALLESLIQESGRRRSRERANLHLRVARVARAESKPAEARAELAILEDQANALVVLARTSGRVAALYKRLGENVAAPASSTAHPAATTARTPILMN